MWLERSLGGQDLIAWTKALALDGELVRAEPKLRLERSWPWAAALATAFARIRALPAPAP